VEIPDDYPVASLRRKGERMVIAIVELKVGAVVAIYEGRLHRSDSAKIAEMSETNTKLFNIGTREDDSNDSVFVIDARVGGNGVADSINDFRTDVTFPGDSEINEHRSPNAVFCSFWFRHASSLSAPGPNRRTAVQEVAIVVTKAIAPGQEILIDYSDGYWKKWNDTTLKKQTSIPQKTSVSPSTQPCSSATTSCFGVPAPEAAGSWAKQDAALITANKDAPRTILFSPKPRKMQTAELRCGTSVSSDVGTENCRLLGRAISVFVKATAGSCRRCSAEICICPCLECHKPTDECRCICDTCRAPRRWFWVEYESLRCKSAKFGIAPSCAINNDPEGRKLLARLLTH
jgi:hypothetical protein